MFNLDSRTKNAARASIYSVSCNVVNVLIAFVYRMIFIQILSAAYLGINGLFTNIISILSFAELGITSAIIYRFYEPITCNDIHMVGQLMSFFKKVYRIIAAIILAIGLILMPFLECLIKDASEIPSDINLKLVYLLFLLQTATSYLFVYKQTILSADQRQYVISIANSVFTFFKFGLQLLTLVISHNYILVLAIGLIWTILTNFLFSEWVSQKYRSVFDVKEGISKNLQKEIMSDTKATLCHKIGITVLSSTDNIIVSKFVGIFATGLFSNYNLIFSNLNILLHQLLGSFTASLGNAHVKQDEEQKYLNYRRLLFANLWVSGVCTVCLYTLIDDFIVMWLGQDMLLSNLTLIMLSAQFFLETSRVVSMSNTSGCGLFVKDKARPLIEATINIFVSIFFVKLIGIPGVFLGTIVSHLCTVTWREPYLLYKYEFHRAYYLYWIYFVPSLIGTLLLCVGFHSLFIILQWEAITLLSWIIKAVIVFSSCNIIALIILHKNEDFLFYRNLIIAQIKK